MCTRPFKVLLDSHFNILLNTSEGDSLVNGFSTCFYYVEYCLQSTVFVLNLTYIAQEAPEQNFKFAMFKRYITVGAPYE